MFLPFNCWPKLNHTGFPNLSREILTEVKSSQSTDSFCVYELIIKKSILDITYNSRRERSISSFLHSFHREKTKKNILKMIQDHKNTFHFPHGFLRILKTVKQRQKLTSIISALVSALQIIKAKNIVPVNLFHLLPSIEYLLLTKFEVCTLSYWPILFHSHLWPNQCTGSFHNLQYRPEKRGHNVLLDRLDDDLDSHTEYLILF